VTERDRPWACDDDACTPHASPPRLRRAHAVALDYLPTGARARNFLAGGEVMIDELCFAILDLTGDWCAPEMLFDELGDSHDRTTIATALLALIDARVLVVEASEAAELDERYAARWRWGATAGLFHFGIKDPVFATPAQAAASISEQVATAPREPLWIEHGADRIPFARPRFEGVLGTMRARRSSRGFASDAALPHTALGEILVSGLGIVGFFETPTPGEGPLPLGMTPSGGARNPFEAYVIAARVEGLAAGVYHYSGVDHSLAPRRTGMAPSFAALLGGQRWFEDAAALVVLVAELPRTMWKYGHPNGYRVVLIEAGHIAQNLLLTATAHGLAAAPTCAITDAAVEDLLHLDRVCQAPLYAIGLGMRGGVSEADVLEVVANPRLAR